MSTPRRDVALSLQWPATGAPIPTATSQANLRDLYLLWHLIIRKKHCSLLLQPGIVIAQRPGDQRPPAYLQAGLSSDGLRAPVVELARASQLQVQLKTAVLAMVVFAPMPLTDSAMGEWLPLRTGARCGRGRSRTSAQARRRLLSAERVKQRKAGEREDS